MNENTQPTTVESLRSAMHTGPRILNYNILQNRENSVYLNQFPRAIEMARYIAQQELKDYPNYSLAGISGNTSPLLTNIVNTMRRIARTENQLTNYEMRIGATVIFRTHEDFASWRIGNMQRDEKGTVTNIEGSEARVQWHTSREIRWIFTAALEVIG